MVARWPDGKIAGAAPSFERSLPCPSSEVSETNFQLIGTEGGSLSVRIVRQLSLFFHVENGEDVVDRSASKIGLSLLFSFFSIYFISRLVHRH